MWKDILHYGAGIALVAFGFVGELGLFKSVFTVGDPHGCLLAGAAILGVGAKADTNTNKLAAGLALLAFLLAPLALQANVAYAADMVPAKAPIHAKAALTDCSVTDCSGFFAGANVAGIGTSLDVLGSGVNQSLFGGGGLIGAEAEYQLWNGKYFVSIGAIADLDMNVNGTAISQNKFLGAVLVKAGYGLGAVFAPAPTTGGAVLSQLQSALLTPYATLGAVPFGHQGWITGAGMAFALSPAWLLTLDYLHIAYKSGAVDGNAALQIQQSGADNIVKIGILRKLTN